MKNKRKGLAIGGLLAAAAGFITGILLAPKSGRQTREDIKQTASNLSESASIEAKKLQANLSRLITKAEAKVKQASQTTGKRGQQIISRADKTKADLIAIAKAVKAGKAKDKDLNTAVKKAQEALKALQAYIKD